MRIPLMAGRNFTDGDRTDFNHVLISEKAAREGFSGENPIGKKINGLMGIETNP